MLFFVVVCCVVNIFLFVCCVVVLFVVLLCLFFVVGWLFDTSIMNCLPLPQMLQSPHGEV